MGNARPAKVTTLFPKRLQARDYGHNRQGVHSLADSKSLRSQTGELSSQFSSTDLVWHKLGPAQTYTESALASPGWTGQTPFAPTQSACLESGFYDSALVLAQSQSPIRCGIGRPILKPDTPFLQLIRLSYLPQQDLPYIRQPALIAHLQHALDGLERLTLDIGVEGNFGLASFHGQVEFL